MSQPDSRDPALETARVTRELADEIERRVRARASARLRAAASISPPSSEEDTCPTVRERRLPKQRR